MRLSIDEIKKIVNGEIKNPKRKTLTGIKTLSEAARSDLTFYSDRRYLNDLLKTKAGAIILPKNTPEEIIEKLKSTLILVENPLLALTNLLEKIQPKSITKNIHPTAVLPEKIILKDVSIGPYSIVSENVKIGENTDIGAFCYIGKNVKIGKKCKIYPNVTILDGVEIGNNVILHSGCVIGSNGFGYVKVKNKHKKIPQIGTVVIEDDVEIGANVTIDRATLGKTIIKKGTKIDNLVQISHNVEIGRNCIIVAQAGIAGSTQLNNNVMIGGQAGIKEHVKIGKNVKIAAQAGVIGDIDDNKTVSGYPAREHRKMMKIHALTNKLPEIWEEIKKWKNKKQ